MKKKTPFWFIVLVALAMVGLCWLWGRYIWEPVVSYESQVETGGSR